MFKPGDKIVFIDNYTIFESEEIYLNKLSLNNIYTVKEYIRANENVPSYIEALCVHILETDDIHYAYRFISLKMYRKLKLLKINNESI